MLQHNNRLAYANIKKIKYLRLSSIFSLHKLDSDVVMLLGEDNGTLLSGKTYIRVLDIIAKGELTLLQLIDSLFGEILPYRVVQIVDELVSKNYVEERHEKFLPSELAFWRRLNIDHFVSLNKKVDFISLDGQNLNSLYDLCHQMNISIGSNSGLKVVLTNDYNSEKLREVNRQKLAENTPWLLVKLNGTQPQLGPLFIPKETACWQCLEQRLVLHQPERNFLLAKGVEQSQIERPVIHHPLAEQGFLHLALLEIIKWLNGQPNSRLFDNILRFNYISMETEYHRVIKRPQCSACGNPKLLLDQQRIIPIGKRSVVTRSGGFRELTHEETWEKYQKHVSSVSGIAPFVKPVSNFNHSLIHNFTSGPNLALTSNMHFWNIHHPRNHNGGKGKTAIQARTGSLCEAIERYSLVHHGQRPAITESFENLAQAIHPNSCMLYSEKQYLDRDRLNEENNRFYSVIPKPFNEKLSIDWTSVYSMTDGQFYYLPSFYCFAHYRESNNQNYEMAYPDTNGGASGNNLEEAILQGFLELVERDAVSIWWYNRLKRPSLLLGGLENEYIQNVLTYYQTINRSIHVLDLTSDLGIPVFGTISYINGIDQGGQKILFGFGSHLDAEIALERSITELNQMLAVDNSEGYLTNDPVFVNWLDQATLDNQPYLLPLKDEVKILKDYPISDDNLHDGIHHCIEICKSNSLNLMVLDMTQPDVGLSVAKVIVPGLRHFWRRTAPGRLYDTPKKMGWLSKSLEEDELNPIPLFI